MYGLNCEYYNKTFIYLDELIQDVLDSGMDPNYEILMGEEPTGQKLIEFIQL